MLSQTIPQLLTDRVANSTTKPAYWQLDNQRNWKSTDWQNLQNNVHSLTCYLKKLGLKKGQVIGIMMNSNLHWEIAHLAILSAGGVVVGLDPNERSEQLRHIFQTADISGMFIEGSDQLNILQKINYSKFDILITSTDCENTGNLPSISSIISKQHQEMTQINDVEPDDIATIIFTSGTTGTPKGIAYTHRQVLMACKHLVSVYSNLNSFSHLVSWLPLSNLFQRNLNLVSLSVGAQVFFVENPKEIIEHLPQINPHVFVSVPRFYEKIYNELENQLNTQALWLRKFIYFSLTQAEGQGARSQLFKKLNTLLLKKFRALFGDNIEYMVSGSAPIPVWLLKRYAAMDLLIIEAYGLSENILPIAANRPDDYQFGSVGKKMSGNEIKLAEDSELLVKGPCLFNGYLGQEKQSIEQDGYYPSGDYAKIDEHGFIYLTGRKSELLKTSTGRKIAPAAIEAQIIKTQGIEQAIIIGDNQPFLTAIITLSNKEQGTSVIKQLTNNLQLLPAYKRPAGIIVSTQAFSLAKNEITTNLKLKRKIIQGNFSVCIEELYSQLNTPNSAIQKQKVAINPDIHLYKIEPSL